MLSVKKLVREQFPELKKHIKRTLRPGDLKAELNCLTQAFGDYASPANLTRNEASDVVSNDTTFERQRIMANFIDILRQEDCHIQHLWNFGAKEIKIALGVWLESGLATPTIRKRLSALRFYYECVLRGDAFPNNSELMPEDRQKVPTYAQRDKTWSGNGVSLEEKLKGLPTAFIWVGHALKLQRLFGLRVTESLLIDVHESDRGIFLWIWRGPKGAFTRFVPIDTAEKRRFLDELKGRYSKGMALIGSEHTISLSKATNKYYDVLREILGISKMEADVTSHGLRVEYLCEQYFILTSELAPICGGRPVCRALDQAARDILALLAGHGRRKVSSAYIGKVLFGWRAKPGEVVPELNLTPELAFVIRHEEKLRVIFMKHKQEALRLRDASRIRPSAAARSPRQRRTWGGIKPRVAQHEKPDMFRERPI